MVTFITFIYYTFTVLLSQHIAYSRTTSLSREALWRAAVECTSNDVIICFDCKTQLLCNGNHELPCADGFVCDEVQGYGACVAEESSTSGCSCTNNENTYIADPYDTSKYILCTSNGGRYELSCDDGKQYVGGQPPCIQTTTVTTTTLFPSTFCSDSGGIGIYPDPEGSCEYFLVCLTTDGPPEIAYCEEDERYSYDKNTCVPLSELTVEPFSCPSTGNELVADPIKCTIFYFCSEGALVDQSSCPESAPYFDPTSLECVNEYDCNRDQCLILGSTTSTLTSTTSTPTSTTSTPTSTTSTPTSTTSTPTSTTSTPTSTTSTPTSTTSTDISTCSTSTISTSTTSTTTTTPTSTTSTSTSTTTTPTTTTSTSTSTTTTPTTTTISTTTTIPLPTAPSCDVVGNYPYPNSCQMFYSCEDSGDGYIVLKEYKCPGSLVFNPNTGFCVKESTYPCSV